MNASNFTDHPVWIPGVQLSACIIYTIIFLLGVIGNILVIIIVSRYRDMRNATNLLLMNLSIADLLMLIFCVPNGYEHLYAQNEHRLGKFMCSFSPFVQNVTSTCSVLTIMGISYERYIAICQPLKTSTFRFTLFRTLPAVIIFWLISCFISIPFFIYSKTDTVESIYDRVIIICETHFPLEWAKEYLISCTVCLYIVIFLMLSYWHFFMCYILFNREALLRDNTILTRYRRQVAQLLIVLTILFFILILPFKIWAVYEHFLTHDELYQIGFRAHGLILIITRTLLYFNSAINPLLYSIMSTKFRQCVMLLCEDCRRSVKGQHSNVVLFGRNHMVKQVLSTHRPICSRTISSTEKFSLNHQQVNQFPEKKTLLSTESPTSPMETIKVSFF